MKITTLSIFAVGSLIATTAMADYTGLSQDGMMDNDDGTWTTRIYANFSEESDQLNAVFGNADSPLTISSSSGFYQHAFGGATSASINPALYDAFPSLRMDSWVSIGLEDNVGNNMLDIGINWDDFENNGGAISTDNGTWFATPDDDQVTAGADLRVLIGQFTTFINDSSHEYGIFGVINLQGKQGDFETFQEFDVVFDFTFPAPGALALLGLAGVASRRRRK